MLHCSIAWGSGEGVRCATIRPAMPPVGYVPDPLYLEHEMPGPPESPARLQAIISHLEESGVLARLTKIEPRDATPDDIELLHSRELVARVRGAAEKGGAWLDPDTTQPPRRRWAFACSITSPSPPPTRWSAAGWSGSPSWTSTCTTATAPRTASTPTRARSTSPLSPRGAATGRRRARAPAKGRR